MRPARSSILVKSYRPQSNWFNLYYIANRISMEVTWKPRLANTLHYQQRQAEPIRSDPCRSPPCSAQPAQPGLNNPLVAMPFFAGLAAQDTAIPRLCLPGLSLRATLNTAMPLCAALPLD